MKIATLETLQALVNEIKGRFVAKDGAKVLTDHNFDATAKAKVDAINPVAPFGATSTKGGLYLPEDKSKLDGVQALDARVAHIEEGSELTVVASDPDADGVYKTVTWTRRDGTTYAKSTLSGDPYDRLTMAYYDQAGATVEKTIAWALTIDANGIVSRKELTE